ncbi:MAG: hypothetical protein H6559_04175 [Lewinellaceae bacterium]|nr:hypothetical protein [Lewinellaceae bacterium]
MKTSKEHNKNRNRRQSGPFIQRMNRQRHAGAAPFLSRQPPPVIQPKLQQGGAGLKRQPGHSHTGEKQDMDGACHGLSQIPYEILKARRKIMLEESFSPASEPGASLENDCTNWEKHLNSIDTELNNRLKTIESESSSYFGFNLKHLALQDLLDRRAILEDIGNGEFPPLKKAQPFGNLINSIFKKPYEINLWLEIYSRKKNLAAPKSLKRSLTGDTYEFAESYEELLAAHRFLHSFAEESEKESVKIIMRDMWQNMYAGLKHNIPARLFNDKLYLLPANKKTDFGHAPNELLSIRSSPGKGGSLTTQDEQWLERLTEDQLLKYLFALEHEISQGSENQNILRYNLRMLQWEYNKRGQFYEDAILSPLGREPIAASDLAPHALGIRAQLKEMFKQDYFKRRDKNYLSAAAADAVPDEVRKALGSDAPAALDVPKYIGYVALFGLEVDLNIPENEKPIDFRVNHLKKEIKAGDRPPAEKEALIQLLEEQHALLKVEKARFLEEFETEARAELKRRLAVSKKIIENERERFKIKTEALSFKDLTESDQAKLAGALAAKRLGRPEIEAALKADVEYYKHSFSNATDPLETIGMAAGAQLLAEKRKEIEDHKEKMKNEIDLIGPKNRAIVGCLWGEGTISGSEYLLKKYHPDYQKPLEALLNAKPIIKEKEEEYLYLRAVIEKEYPILASWAAKNDREGLERISRGVSSVGEDLGMAQMLGTEIREKLQNIAVVEHRVDTDKSIIWEMGEIMAGAKQAMRVPEFSIYDFWVNDTLRRKREDKEFWDTFLSVLSISLGALAAPLTGGASLALTAAGAAVGGYETLKKLEKYQWEQTLYGTDFDPARAIIHQEPSLSWLAMDLIGLGLDVADIVKILKVAKSTKIVPARGINSESFTDLIGQLDTATKKKVNIRIQAIDAIKDSQLKFITEEIGTHVNSIKISSEGDYFFKIDIGNGKFWGLNKKATKWCRIASPPNCYISRAIQEAISQKIDPQIVARKFQKEFEEALSVDFEKLGFADGLANKVKKAIEGDKKALSDLVKIYKMSQQQLVLRDTRRLFGNGIQEVLDSSNPRFRHDPYIGSSLVYRDEGGNLGRVTKIDSDTVLIETRFGQSTQRADYQNFLLSAGSLGLPTGMEGFERLHALGKILGHESPFGIYLGPRYVNHVLQKDGIEKFISIQGQDFLQGNEGFLSALVKKETHSISSDSGVSEADFLHTITYRISDRPALGNPDIQAGLIIELEVVEPNNPLSDTLVEIHEAGRKPITRTYRAEEFVK